MRWSTASASPACKNRKFEGPEEPEEPARDLSGTLYLRLPSEQDPDYPKVRAVLNMFPGESPVILFFADTRVRRGTRCGFREPMLRELERRLGKENVVLK